LIGRDISYSGLAGALLGFGICAALAVALAAGAGTASRWWAVPLAVIALLFLPALICSVMPTPARSMVLRATTIGCLVIGAGGLFIDPTLAVVLAPPTGLLAVGAGFVMQGRR
jgi:hypothetical protein